MIRIMLSCGMDQTERQADDLPKREPVGKVQLPSCRIWQGAKVQAGVCPCSALPQRRLQPSYSILIRGCHASPCSHTAVSCGSQLRYCSQGSEYTEQVHLLARRLQRWL